MRKNSLYSIPSRSDRISWYCSEGGFITVKLYNEGFCNKLCQKVFRHPESTRVSLDKIGSEVWILLDGRRNVIEIGEKVSQKFGADAEPLYERLTVYIKELCNNKMVRLNKPEKL